MVDIVTASNSGDIDTVRQLLDRGVDPNTMINGRTALHAACDEGHYDMVRLLIKYGADIDMVDSTGRSPLEIAILSQESDIAELLLRNGAIPGTKALMDVLEVGIGTYAVELMVMNGVNVNIGDDNDTPLTKAIFGQDPDTVMVLIKAAANVNKPNNQGTRPLVEAITEDHHLICKILLENGADPNLYNKKVVNDRGQGLHNILTITSDEVIIGMLIDNGATIDFETYNGETALMYHAGKGHYDIVRMLLDSGADIQHRNIDHMTSLLEACDRGSVDIVQLLLSRGARLDVVDVHGRTPLMIAASSNSLHLVEILLSLGVDIDATDNEGNTALMTAVSAHNPLIVEYLIRKGANIDHRDKKGNTSLLYCIIGDNNSYIADILIKAGADVNMRYDNGNTALIYAAHLVVPLYIINRLIRAGADVNAHNHNGRTALINAIQNGVYLGVKFLLDNGANPNDRDVDSNTALMEAVERNYMDICTLLIKYGAYTYIKNNNGETASSLTTDNDLRNFLNSQPSSIHSTLDRYK